MALAADATRIGARSAGFTLALLAVFGACSSPPTAAQPEIDAGAARPTYDAASWDSSFNPDPPPPTIEGWEPWGDYDPACRFYVPKDREHMPPPFSWRPCIAAPENAGMACRALDLNWTRRPNQFQYLSAAFTGIRLTNGRIAFAAGRFQDDGTIRMIAEVDGPIHVAIREQAPLKCVLNSSTSDGEHYAFRVLDAEAKGEVSSYGGGGIGGRLDQLKPSVVRHYHDQVSSRAFFAGAPGLLELHNGAMDLYAWTNGALLKTVWTAAQDNGLAQNYQFFHRDVLFWASDSELFNKQKVWTEAGGVKDFLTFGDDYTKGAADLGTDGTDLVWVEGTGRSSGVGVFPDVAVYAAPFSTDPTSVQANRRIVRKGISGYGFGGGPFRVGCGYAARSTGQFDPANPQAGGGTMLIRLSDGAMWALRSSSTALFGWKGPEAVTCDELFVRVGENSGESPQQLNNFARVRIDSLGTPIPAPP